MDIAGSCVIVMLSDTESCVFFQYQVYRFKGTSCFQNINKFQDWRIKEWINFCNNLLWVFCLVCTDHGHVHACTGKIMRGEVLSSAIGYRTV